jgi:hypothetical protein
MSERVMPTARRFAQRLLRRNCFLLQAISFISSLRKAEYEEESFESYMPDLLGPHLDVFHDGYQVVGKL